MSGNELSPAAGWEFLQNFQAITPRQDLGSQVESAVETGLIENPYSDSGSLPFVMPKLYSTEMNTQQPSYTPSLILKSAIRTMYVQYAPNSTFATVQHVPLSLLSRFGTEQIVESRALSGATVASSYKAPQPFASVYCLENIIDGSNDTRPITFPETYVIGCTVSECNKGYHPYANTLRGYINTTRLTRQQVWEEGRSNLPGRILWIDDMETNHQSQPVLLGAVIVQPDRCGANSNLLAISACVVGARWANTTAYTKGFMKGNYRGSLATASATGPVENDFSIQSLHTIPDWSQPSVKLSKAWAESLDAITGSNNRTVVQNLLQPIITGTYNCSGEEEPQDLYPQIFNRNWEHERIIATLVANGMSHAAGPVEDWHYEGKK
jgi:hypothetical protein